MVLIDGKEYPDYMTRSKAARLFGIPFIQIDRWVDKYGAKPNGIRLYDTGTYKKVHLLDLQRVIENNGILPDVPAADETPEDVDGMMDPCEARYLFIIYRDGRKLETWGRMPTQAEIEESFGAGKYRIVQIDTENNGVTVTSQSWDLKGAPRPDEMLTPYLQGMERLAGFQKTFGGNGGDGNGSSKLIEIMMNGQQSLINTLLPLAMGRKPAEADDKFEKALSQIQMLRELGLLEQPATGRTTADLLMGLIEKGGDVLAVIGPQIMAKLGAPMPAGTSAPAPGPVPADFTMQGLNKALTGQLGPGAPAAGTSAPHIVRAESPAAAPATEPNKIKPLTPEAVARFNTGAQ